MSQDLDSATSSLFESDVAGKSCFTTTCWQRAILRQRFQQDGFHAPNFFKPFMVAGRRKSSTISLPRLHSTAKSQLGGLVYRIDSVLIGRNLAHDINDTVGSLLLAHGINNAAGFILLYAGVAQAQGEKAAHTNPCHLFR